MKKGFGIRAKTVFSTVSFTLILTFAIAAIGFKLYKDSVMRSYRSYADTVLKYAYSESVKYSFGDMIAARYMPKNYEELRNELNTIKENSGIEYLYAIYFNDINDIHSLHYAINAKTKKELEAGGEYTYLGQACETGAFEDDTLQTLQQAVKSGKRDTGSLDGYSDTYGHMLNGYHVIFDSKDNPVGLICVEIDINRIYVDLWRYVLLVILTATAVTAVIVLLHLHNTNNYLIKPILTIADNSESFVKKMEANADPDELIFEDVKVKSEGELHLLAENVKRMADGVSTYMTNLKEATSEKERISTELSLATKIQAAMLPHSFPPFPGRTEFDIYAVMDPAKEVGGDFYDFFLIDDDHLGLVMADVSGKGIPAALFMMVSKIILQSCAMLGRSPAEILTKTNEALSSNNQANMFVTVWLGILEISTGKLTAANAGHEYPAIRQNGGEFVLYKDRHGFAVGGMEGTRYTEYELQLKPGDKLFLYTDGVPEATDKEDMMFGNERMLSALNKNTEADSKQLLMNVRTSVNAFVKDAEQFDDLTMMCLEYKGK